MEIPRGFFTMESMTTLAGATLITTVITNVIQHTFSWNPKWLGLSVAMIIAMVGVTLTPGYKLADIMAGIINGFFIYANSIGFMQMIGNSKVKVPTRPGRDDAKLKRRFLDKWY
jgi:hypothetical protein